MIDFIHLYFTSFSNKRALNSIFNVDSILVTGTMGEIDESKVGARLGSLPVSWSCILRRVHWTPLAGVVTPSDLVGIGDVILDMEDVRANTRLSCGQVS